MIAQRVFPFPLSKIALLVVCCLTPLSHAAEAENDIPAVLQFARQYQQQQQMSPPVYHPRTKPRVIKKGGHPQPAKEPHSLGVDHHQLKQLQHELVLKDQQLTQQSTAIKQLEKSIAALQKTASAARPSLEQTSIQQAGDQALLDLKNVLSLSPTSQALTEKLKQANKKLNDAHQNETDLRNQLKNLNVKLDELEKNSQSQRLNAAQQQSVNQKNIELMQQIKVLTRQQAQSEKDLAHSRQQIQDAEEQQVKIEQQMKLMTANSESERTKFAAEKQRLLQQIATGHDADRLQVRNNQALKEAQEKLNAAQQQQAALQSDKSLLEKLLIARPTAEQLSVSRLETKSLQTQLDALKLQHAEITAAARASEVRIAELTAAKKTSDDRANVLQAKLDAALQQQNNTAKNTGDAARILELTAGKKASDDRANLLQAKLDAALAKPGATAPNALDVTSEQLAQKTSREAYAIGVSLGAEILQMQHEDAVWGLPGDKRIVLAGIIDAFQNKAKLPSDSLRKTLTELSSRVKTEREKVYQNLDKKTKSYLAAFTRKKGTIKSPTGFWYHIDYSGDSAIPENAILDVVVKESLTNGKVITDMDTNGTMLTQPAADFPPVFQEALRKLRNHGSITLVVPPKLAYGSKGYPPNVPPNATMVYELRISDFYPENLKKAVAKRKQ